jgi:hypothetical protein
MNRNESAEPPEGEPDHLAGTDERPENERGRSQAKEAADWAARLTARVREDAEDVLAEARSLREREAAPLRKGLLYGLAGAMNAGERIAAAARGAAAGARAASPGRATDDKSDPDSQALSSADHES